MIKCMYSASRSHHIWVMHDLIIDVMVSETAFIREDEGRFEAQDIQPTLLVRYKKVV